MEFDGLKIGDTVNLITALKRTKVKVLTIEDRTLTIEGGRTFNKSTGYACDGAIVFIQRIK